ncbi:GGDEF domain-containing protein [Herbaspirillum sp. LeCh32-8]|uniref:sensor domain-containing diguanylate cyclase n=1 Tax=Herbaspirillum sp. LeCh32-8 TaxID=2821356 RepID=UPI001AEB0BB3|nr:sensor domain-containing diguanylate cyclase [Herbaspirillum sp. LeCh32-8]MBP0597693.1 GGDEF domain-containing protein [Herbaspirillum sp. LeCh32-8]
MFFKKRTSPVCIATLFVVLACLALVGLDGWRTWQAREDLLKEARVDTSNMAQGLAQHADQTYHEADLALQVLLEHVAEDGLNERSLQRIGRQLMSQVNELPQLHGIFVYDESGRWLVSSQRTLQTQYNNSDRAYFIYHKTHSDPLPHVGPPVQSRSTDEWIFTISRRINKPDGAFGGVVLATLSLEYFKNYYQNFDVGRRGAVLFALNSGTSLIRRTRDSATTGKDLTNVPLFRDYASKSDRGTVELVAPSDGELRINSFVHLRRYPMFITVAVSKDEVLANWRHDAYLRTIGVLFLAGVLATMGRRMVRQIKTQVRSEYEAVTARTKSDQLNATLVQLAMHDGLTGLPNRRHFDRTLAAELLRQGKDKGALSLVMIDVDHFKLYNDIYGHTKGDECLKTVARAIGAARKRSRDLAARYGGEEFALVLPDCDIHGAMSIAYNLRQSIAELRLPHSGAKNGHVTVSIGVASLHPVQENDSVLTLIEHADQALYQAKQSGRDRIVTYPANLKSNSRDEPRKSKPSRSAENS